MLALLPKLAPWPFARAGSGVRKATRQAPLFGYAMTSADNGEFKITETYKYVEGTTNYSGWAAFDSSSGTAWYPADKYANNYVQIECAKPRSIASFSAYQDTSNGNHSGYLPTTIRIMGSNDGTNYVQIANSSMTYAYDAVETKVYVSNTVKIASPKPYKFYRIYIAPTNHPFVLLAGLILQEAIPPTPLLAAQYRFIDKEAINEVNEAFATLTGTFSVADGKLTTGSTTSSFATMPRILFDDGEDFCIRLRHTFTTTSAGENPIIAVWNDASVTGSVAWALWRNGSNAGNKKIGFGINPVASGARLYSINDIPDNVEVEIEVSRTNGTMYLFVDGALQQSIAYTGGNTQTAAMPEMRTDVYAALDGTPRTNFFNGGQKSALQIYKNKGGHTANYAKGYDFDKVTTPEYSSTDQDALVVNMALRRDNAINEITDTYLPVSGGKNFVRRGRIVHDVGTGSFTSMRSDRFGDADFTVECKVNITAVNSTTGGVFLGEWFRSDQVNTNNRWMIYLNASRVLTFYVGKIDTTGAALVLSGPTLAYGIDYHIVVERVNGTITIYVNGAAVASTAYAAALPGIAPYNVATNSTANYYGWSGEIWNVRIAKKALYNGDIAAPYVLPKAKRERVVYTADEAKAVVLQYDFVSAREEKLGLYPTLGGTSASAAAMLVNNTLTTTINDQASFSLPAEDFINDDFTIETTVSIDAFSPANNTRYPILAKWTMGTANNSWSLAVSASKQLGFFVSPDGTFDNAVGGWVGPAITFGKEMHVVVECINRVVKIYVDTVAIGTINLPSKATVPTFATNANPITNVFADDSTRRAAMTFKRIRIANKALFNGVVVNAKTWPRFARKYKRVHMSSGQATSAFTGGNSFTVTGFAQNISYQTPQSLSIGSTSDTLFRTLDGKTKRLAALFHRSAHSGDSNAYLMLMEKDSTIAPTSDMPVYSRVLSLNGKAYDLAETIGQNPTPEGFGATIRFWTTGTAFGPFLYTGRTSSFEFLPPATVVTIGTVTLPSNVAFKGYMKDLTDVADAGSLTNDQVIDISNPRACKLYKIRGLWTQSNNYLCIGLETLATDSYANLEKLYPDIINIPRLGTTLFSGDDIPGKTFASATTINQTPTGKPPYVQYYWSLTTAQVNALNAGTTANHYFG